PDEGGLAVTVAPDDPDPVPFGDAERHPVEQGTGAVHLAHVLDIDQVDGHFSPARWIDQLSSVGPGEGRSAREVTVTRCHDVIGKRRLPWSQAAGSRPWEEP